MNNRQVLRLVIVVIRSVLCLARCGGLATTPATKTSATTREPLIRTSPKTLLYLSTILGLALGLIYLGWLGLTTPAQAQGGDITAQAVVGTAFTYQGRLMQNSAPVNGTCSLTFKLYDALTGGSQVGSDVTNGSVNRDSEPSLIQRR